MMRFLEELRLRFVYPVQRRGAALIILLWPNVTPNKMCLWRKKAANVLGALLSCIAVSVIVGVMLPTWLYVMLVGLVLVVGVPAYYTDLFDGTVGLILDERRGSTLTKEAEALMTYDEKINHPGRTQIGKELDAMADKRMYACIGMPLSIIGGFFWLMLGTLFVELLLILVRPFKEHVLGVKDTSANILGKIKSNVQPYALLIICLITLVGPIGRWVSTHYAPESIITVLMTLILVSQLGSLAGHIVSGLRIKWGYDQTTA